MPRISKSRRVAFEVLQNVSQGAFASDSLRQASRDLETRDAGLASQLVFGCLRYQAQLDHLIFFYSGRAAGQLDQSIATVLRMGIFQMRYLERIPVHAAVHESVELAKRHQRSAAGLVNAVLRKVNRAAVQWPDAETELSCPAWLLKRWTEHFGDDLARGIAKAALEEPVPYIRIPPGTALPAGLELAATEISGCFRVIAGDLTGVRLHDISSQSIVPLLDLASKNTYLDLCAAPGNKTVQALESKPSLTVACDVSLNRIREISPLCPRVVLDASAPLPFARTFDRIFIDAPCSGTGTLARNPEIKWRVKEQDFELFSKKQIEIVSQAVRLLESGGNLLYATCSLEREENEDVVAAVLSKETKVVLIRESWRVPGQDAGDGFYAAVLGIR